MNFPNLKRTYYWPEMVRGYVLRTRTQMQNLLIQTAPPALVSLRQQQKPLAPKPLPSVSDVTPSAPPVQMPLDQQPTIVPARLNPAPAVALPPAMDVQQAIPVIPVAMQPAVCVPAPAPVQETVFAYDPVLSTPAPVVQTFAEPQERAPIAAVEIAPAQVCDSSRFCCQLPPHRSPCR
jgi:hypothetical protein